MRIGGLQKSSTLDFPGQLACVIFTRGCNLNCFYCHNRELLNPNGDGLDEEALFSFLKKRQGFLDGVVISGGEPTLQPALTEFMGKIQALGYRIKLDTNGQRPEVITALLEKNLLDYVAVDWKSPEEEFQSVCGTKDGLGRTRETLSLLADSDVPYEARTTLYPGLTVEKLTGLAKALPPVPLWRLNFYRVPESYRPEDEGMIHQPALSPGEIREAEDILRSFQPNLVF